MKIVVLAKQVPDTWSDRHLDMVTGIVDRSNTEQVPDEISERAMEVALRYRDEAGSGVEITALTMGPGSSSTTLRKMLAMGADSAVLINDDALVGADALRTAQILALAVQRLDADLVIAGDRSTDGHTGVVPAMVAELTGATLIPAADHVTLSAQDVTATVPSDGVELVLAAPYPAVLAVTEKSAEPRLVKVTSIMAARRKPLDTWSLADLGENALTPSPVASVMVSARQRDEKPAGTVLNLAEDDTAIAQLADFISGRQA